MKKVLELLKDKQFRINLGFYISGFFVVGLGVNILRSSNLGMGAWDTVTFNLYDYFYLTLGQEWVLVGYVSMFVSIIIFLIVFLYRRKWKMLLMLVPVLIMGNVINFWYYLVFNGYVAEQLAMQLFLFVIGTFVLPFGLSLVIKSSFPAFVFDEFTFMWTDVFKTKNFGKVRFFIELLGLSVGALFGYLAFFHVDKTLGAVTIGSLIIALVFGKIMAVYLKLLKVQKDE